MSVRQPDGRSIRGAASTPHAKPHAAAVTTWLDVAAVDPPRGPSGYPPPQRDLQLLDPIILQRIRTPQAKLHTAQ
jgi:hypothetical protein